MKNAYYNEIDPKAAAWLRELIRKGNIAPGDVDERSIEDVTPDDLRGYSQCHFFAGIGIWSHALRNAGWADDKPIWTGSCPCQPFSAAGKGKGVNDERHLWPAFHWLIKQCRPDIILGEQVAQKAGAAWFDIVSTDLEGEGYTCGKIVFPACGVGAPHLRQRQYWVGHSASEGFQIRNGGEVYESRKVERPERSSSPLQLADAKSVRIDKRLSDDQGRTKGSNARERSKRLSGGDIDPPPASGPTNGHWRAPDWLFCRDGKWRPVESGSFPLVNGTSSRVVSSGDHGQQGNPRNSVETEEEIQVQSTKEARTMRLRGYGNGIVSEQAQAFIECVEEILTERSEVT